MEELKCKLAYRIVAYTIQTLQVTSKDKRFRSKYV
jgi:hypothetical protein